MNGPIARAFVVAAFSAAVLAPNGVLAQSRPQPQHVLSRGFSQAHAPRTLAAPVAKNDRRLYGRIEAIKSSILLVRARTGRNVRVDMTDALRTGMYSAPLFAGKLVMITGYYDNVRTLHAQIVMRESRLDERTGPDR
jgi:hypothetical protein